MAQVHNVGGGGNPNLFMNKDNNVDEQRNVNKAKESKKHSKGSSEGLKTH